MTKYIENFKKFQPLLYELVARDVKIKYRKICIGGSMDFVEPSFNDGNIVGRVLEFISF